jgi:hypothetical protein
MLSMIGHPSGAEPLMVDVRQTGSGSVVLWQQLKRVSVTWPDDREMAAIERGDPNRALPFGEGDHGCVRPAQPQVRVSADQVLDALPVSDTEVCASWSTVAAAAAQ